jgi:hypothetical protein
MAIVGVIKAFFGKFRKFVARQIPQAVRRRLPFHLGISQLVKQ